MKHSQSCDICASGPNSPLCNHPQARSHIDRVKVKCRYKQGQTIFYSGNEPLGLFIIQEGVVSLETVSPQGTAHTLRIVGAGGILGYRSLFSNEPYKASALAIENCELCFIPKPELYEIIRQFPEVALGLMDMVCKDLRHAEQKWVDQIDKGASARVAESLLFLQDHFTDQHWTRREIAQWAGTTPETVMRTLAQFEKSGWIEQQGRRIILLDRRAIETIE